MMNYFQTFFSRKLFLLGLLLVVGVSLTGCSGRLMTANSWPGLALQNDTVYVTYQQSVRAIQKSNGDQVWSFPEKPENQITFFADPMVVDDLVVVGDYKTTLYGIDAKNGLERWKFEGAEGRWISGATLAGDIILAPNVDYSLYALDLQGNLEWKFTTDNALWGKPVSDGEAVYTGSMDHLLYALDIEDGSLIWSADMGGAIVSSPFLSDEDVLYIGTLSNEMIAVDAANGKILWRFETNDGMWGAPVFAEDNIYFGDASGTIYALNDNGKLQWKMAAGSTITSAAGITTDNLLFATEAGELIAIGFDGEKLWTRTIDGDGGKLYRSPIIAEEDIILAVLEGENLLVTIDFNGNERWSFTPEK